MIRNAIVPVAGLGTRLLPATKSQPKEMLPVARKPIVQYVVEELAACGLENILFVTGRNKSSIENHFDSDPELARHLGASNKTDLLQQVEQSDLHAHFYYTRQRTQRGLGDAVLCGETFAGDQPFVVALGDSILGLHAKSRCVSRMIEVFEQRRASCVIAVEEVPREQTMHYGVIHPADQGDGCLRVIDVVEKPAPEQAPSNLAIAGRYIFAPILFEMIRRVQPDRRGEIQLTDAIRMMCQEGRRVLAVQLPPGEQRYDIGNFPSYFETFVEFALADEEFGPHLRDTLRRLVS